MKTFRIKFRPFANAFIDEMDIETDTLTRAHEMFRGSFPKGKILVSGELESSNEPIDNVIYVDFKARRRVELR